MRLKEEEEKKFEKIIDEFCKVHGRDALKATFQLHARLRKEVGIKYFPILNIFHYLLYLDLNDKYKTIQLKKIAEIEQVPQRTMYSFFHDYVKRKKKTPNSLRKP